MSLATYHEFIRSKGQHAAGHGFSCSGSWNLFPHQLATLRFACERGRSAAFLDTGLGKSRVEAAAAAEFAEQTGKPSLILTPLAVARQMQRKCKAIGIDAVVIRDASDVAEGVNIANYERLPRLDPSVFGGVVLDESSILKNQTKVLNGRLAKGQEDEKHICPLQLDVIERCLTLYSNPGDLVLDPFNGIGSTGYQALKMGRRYLGIELKPEYAKQAARFLQQAEGQAVTLFDEVPA